jgi:DNA-binding MarR family transcriptional regulator
MSLDKEIAYLISLLPQFITTVFRGCEIKACVPLNPSEERTLMHIMTNPHEPMGVYSRKIGLSKGSFTTVADSLEQKGLIKRYPMQEDRRISCLLLTNEGEEVARDINEQFVAYIAQKISPVHQEEKTELKDALEKIMQTIPLIESKQ